MTELTTEKVLNQVQDGMKAFEAFKTEFEKADLKKLDILDEAKFTQMSDDIANAIDASQKQNAELKAANDKLAKLEAAMDRPSHKGSVDAKEVEAKQKDVFNDFLKKGASAAQASDFSDYLSQKGDKLPEEVKALAVNSQADGGYLVMPAFGGIVGVREFESSPMRELASVVQINTDSYELVLDNDEAASGWVGETATRSNTNTPTLDKRIIPVHELYAQPLATQKMLDDAIVDVESWLAGKVGEKFGRDEATAFVSGNGVTQPTGFLTNTTTGTSYDAKNVQVVASATQGAIVYDDLIDLTNALKESYQGNATFLYKRATNANILKIKSGITDDNTPIFNMAYTKDGGVEPTLLGKRVRFADDMPAFGNDANAIAYGDFRKGYLVVDRIGIRVLRDPFTSKPYVKFYTTKRVGGDVINAEAIKILGLTG